MIHTIFDFPPLHAVRLIESNNNSLLSNCTTDPNPSVPFELLYLEASVL